MAITPISATQQRVTALYELSHDDSYDMAARVLEAAGLPRDGVPAGHTWRTVKKLSDDELRAALPTPVAVAAPVATAVEAQAERSAESRERQQRIRDYYNEQARRIGCGEPFGSRDRDARDDLADLDRIPAVNHGAEEA
jgi:hypothetical protein